MFRTERYGWHRRLHRTVDAMLRSLSAALYTTLVVFNNGNDYGSNFIFVAPTGVVCLLAGADRVVCRCFWSRSAPGGGSGENAPRNHEGVARAPVI
jgi:hypothetical protein